MKVRDHLYKESEYKGKECIASDKYCPCRSCYNCHDCGYMASNGIWRKRFHCATNYTKGCPLDINNSLPIPMHIFKFTKRFERRKRGSWLRCLRCNQLIEIGAGYYNFINDKDFCWEHKRINCSCEEEEEK